MRRLPPPLDAQFSLFLCFRYDLNHPIAAGGADDAVLLLKTKGTSEPIIIRCPQTASEATGLFADLIALATRLRS